MTGQNYVDIASWACFLATLVHLTLKYPSKIIRKWFWVSDMREWRLQWRRAVDVPAESIPTTLTCVGPIWLYRGALREAA